jgi:hypothetical protein
LLGPHTIWTATTYIGNATFGGAFHAGDYETSRVEATWLPDEHTAKLWLALIKGE